MKSTFETTRLASLTSLAVTMLLTSCEAQRNTPQPGDAADPVYETAEEIQAMPPCQAVVAERGPCFVYLRTAEGKGFYIGSPGCGAEVTRFLDALKDGGTYKFPQTFMEYERQRRRAGP